MADIFAAKPAGRSNIGCLRGVGGHRMSGGEMGGREQGHTGNGEEFKQKQQEGAPELSPPRPEGIEGRYSLLRSK